MTISEGDALLENNPHMEKLVHGFPSHHSGRGLGGGLKIDNGFNDLLKTIKKENSRGLTRSNIETK